MFRDARQVPRDAHLRYDVAIIGAGMAGITLTQRLRGLGRRVCLLEGGGIDPGLRAQGLNAGRTTGQPYFGLDRCRFRVFGGATIRWGGWCRPFDPEDFERREWIPGSGWPIGFGDLRSHLDQVADLVELASGSFAVADWRDRLGSDGSLGAPDFDPVVVQHCAEIDFGERARAELAAADDVTVLLHANVTALRLAPGTDRVERLQVATLSGNRLTVGADTVVLAAGGIENPRLLLASAQDRPRGLGNESDAVGRCFMEHPHAVLGHILLRPGRELPPFFRRRELGASAWAHGSLAPSAASARAQRRPTCFLTLEPMPHVAGPSALLDLPQPLMVPPTIAWRRLQRAAPVSAGRVRSAVATGWRLGRETRHVLTTGASARTMRDMVSVYARSEQTPNPASRVTLDGARDALGVPRPRLDWRIAEGDLQALEGWSRSLGESLRRSGFGEFAPAGWREGITGGPHHMGTTRMSSSPADGVVDRDCRVHSLENLYVTGSSVFTTGGHANPSYTMLALTLRLADHLRSRIAPAPRSAPRHVVPSEGGVRRESAPSPAPSSAAQRGPCAAS